MAARNARLLLLGVSLLHLYPARKHMGMFFEHPNLTEAWKGFGAVFAIVVLALPLAWQVRALRALSARRLIVPVSLVLVAAHAVPMLDHLPQAATSLNEAWRGIGSLFAMMMFLMPSRVRARLVGLVTSGAPRFAALASVALALVSGCASKGFGASDGGADMGSAPGPACPPCVTDQDCKGGVCAQLGSDSFCAPLCPNGNECSSDRSCVTVHTISGDTPSACVLSAGDVCAAQAADAGMSSKCGDLVGPDVAAMCTSCKGKSNCQPNGCYGGWWCNTKTNACQAPPADCGNASDSGVAIGDSGAVTGSIGPNGGSMSRLYFTVVGDTRPPFINDTSAYPTAIITKIFQDIEALSPKPPFTLATGDYNFASSVGPTAAAQFSLYAGARAKYSGLLFPAMGNHECTGSVSSNCGNGNTDGITANFSAFTSTLLQPIQKSAPYYAININDTNMKWTAKFVFIAANAWDGTQAAWLDMTLAQSTTYTFVIRHEPAGVYAPGVSASEKIMANYPYTLSLVGHTHTYHHYNGREVVIGNGGAPLTGTKSYGFALLNQRQDGAIQVDMIDHLTGLADGAFRFAVKPDGSPAP